jgi:hypothetical protein
VKLLSRIIIVRSVWVWVTYTHRDTHAHTSANLSFSALIVHFRQWRMLSTVFPRRSNRMGSVINLHLSRNRSHCKLKLSMSPRFVRCKIGEPFPCPIDTRFRRRGAILMEIFGIHPIPSSRRIFLLRWSKKIASHKGDFRPLLLDWSCGWWMWSPLILPTMYLSDQILCIIFRRDAETCEVGLSHSKQSFKQIGFGTLLVAGTLATDPCNRKHYGFAVRVVGRKQRYLWIYKENANSCLVLENILIIVNAMLIYKDLKVSRTSKIR